MLKSNYIEDIFVDFCDHVVTHGKVLHSPDAMAANSFLSVIESGGQLTKNQAGFILKILEKYKNLAMKAGLDYIDELQNPVWKNSFRVLDLSKRIYVEKDDNGELWICAKFPFALKETFEKEISPVVKDYSSSVWDHEERVRRLKFYNFNLVNIYEVVSRHGFEIDDSFMIALADVEEIWQNSESIIPYSEKHFGATVDLVNASHETVEWFEQNRTGHQPSDMLLAKSMGYPLKDLPKTLVEKIASSDHSRFWLKSLDQFFEIYKDVGGPVAVVLNKGDTAKDWVKQFCYEAEKNGIFSGDIRVCFRMDKNEDQGFNQWVKDSGYGGKVEGGQIFIFQNKPPKWLFSENKNVKIVLTNSLYPVPSATTQAWMDTHTCVCFVGDIKAAYVKEKKIVEL